MFEVDKRRNELEERCGVRGCQGKRDSRGQFKGEDVVWFRMKGKMSAQSSERS